MITAPFLFDELFALFGEAVRIIWILCPDPWYRLIFATGLNDYRRHQQTPTRNRPFSPEDTANYDWLVAHQNRF